MLSRIWSTLSGLTERQGADEMTEMQWQDSVLGELVCGRPHGDAKADKTLQHLSRTINTFSTKGVRYLQEEFSDESKYFSAFCARVVLENSSAAIVGRLDPFRLLYLNEFQSQPSFEHGAPAKSGFRWQGDVMNPDKPLGQDRIWSSDVDIAKISRSLFSEHFDHLIWRPAYSELLDQIQNSGRDEFEELISIEPEAFVPRMRGELGRLYSSLSKGVHWDFFNSAIEYDESSIKANLQDLFSRVSILGLTSHFIPTAYSSLMPDDAFDIYAQMRSHVS
ncbi:hypothetical protein ROSMUCSMR3_03936 [Roseovarius mucosus]|uniref:Uncharacterized protein n=1 Tax=Roseovarius mucosus TaxID=215743 RepID=A0A1V0RUX6_9RHOB|nr:hypothetical protein [Roseovarius mucosus]ARE85382.1 hypothetical protein ROSMUCSMR3_03936 [Roseovarius mucosus]